MLGVCPLRRPGAAVPAGVRRAGPLARQRRVQALEADIKEIYFILARRNSEDEKFDKLSLEKKLLKLNANLLATAKEAGIKLPR